MASAPPTTAGSFRTRGHARAVATVRAMLAGRVPHALLIGGPVGVGKTTLALDLAAGLLCDAEEPTARPCRACRACRLVDRGIHPDLHRLAPAGPGDQIRIGARDRPEDGTVRRLAADLALLPVEGRARVAVVERADRMGDDAQTALLKTLEEPPPGTTIILCADDDDRLMPTVRSRCARIRLGPVAMRDVEALLADDPHAEPPLAARLARLSAGRPGLAQVLARSPDAVAARDELLRLLVDLLGAGPAARLGAVRDLLARAGEVGRAIDRGAGQDQAAPSVAGTDSNGTRGRRRRAMAPGAGRAPAVAAPAVAAPAVAAPAGERIDPADDDGVEGEVDGEPGGSGRATGAASAAERRRGVGILIGLWRDLARDLLVVGLGLERAVRDPALLDDLRRVTRGDANTVDGHRDMAAFLARLDVAGELLEANVRPELIVDSLVLAWPRWPAATEPR